MILNGKETKEEKEFKIKNWLLQLDDKKAKDILKILQVFKDNAK